MQGGSRSRDKAKCGKLVDEFIFAQTKLLLQDTCRYNQHKLARQQDEEQMRLTKSSAINSMLKLRKEKLDEKTKKPTNEPTTFIQLSSEHKMEECRDIAVPFASQVCFISKIHARANVFEVCDKHYSIRAHFVGATARTALEEKIKEQSAELNVLGLLGKQVRIKTANIKVV